MVDLPWRADHNGGTRSGSLGNHKFRERRLMQLGLVTYMWGADWDLPTVIKNCRDTGFAGVELRSGHKHGVEPTLSAEDRKMVTALFNNSGVQLVGLGSACEYHSPDPAVLKK